MKVIIANHEYTIIWDGVYYFALSDYPHISNWELRKLACFMQYEKANGRETEIVCDDNKIIRFKDYNAAEFESWNNARLTECKYRYSQHLRVLKYVYRGQYLEAYAYYNRYVLEPLIDILRLIYTPANADYYLIHISHHVPQEYTKKLEYFAQTATIEDIDNKIPQAEKWFNELLKKLER